ncbi:Linear gramicidin synthase subunit D [Cupriavidus numazuensis]|uniref:Linear gramicidin synthase subunit D n=4 Tax=Cupriavidus numazuensis TaxID=221992 RepID=A0ABM8TX36_9BURK|nr:Linear gramicidin synthase subunit D [Cupriavidus numazuensis]
MVPGAIVVLDALPLNPNGKVDRKALPEPGQLASAGYEAPQGEVEAVLAEIWADVLKLPRVGRHDNFFTLGGHSLLAIQLLERVRRHGWPVAVRTLFQHPVLQDFARAVGGEASTEVVVPPNGIPADCTRIEPSMLTLVSLEEEAIRSIEAAIPGGAANIQDIYPLAPLQQGILFHHLLQAEGDAYITTCLLAFDSRARLAGFMDHLNAVIARHDILRTAVLWEGLPEPVQVVCREATLVPEWLEPGDQAEARLLAAVDPSHYRLDVRRAPLLGALAVHDTEADRWLLQLPSHHLVMDHTTLELLVEEIGLLTAGRAEALPTPVPFRRYVAQARLGVSEAQHEAFFRQMLGEVETPTAPYGLLDVRGDGTRVGEARLPLPPALSAKLRQLAQRHGVSAATLFHLAWALVVGRSAGQDDVVFGTVLFGRMQGGEDAQRALGLFINTLPLRVKLGPVAVAQALRDTHAGLTGLLTHEHASLALAQRCSSVPSGTPLFSALLNYRYSAPAQSQAQWEGMTTLGGDERNNYPFTMNVDDLGEDFALVAQVVQPLDPQQVCEALHGTLAALASALEKHPQQLLCELEGISGPERTQLEQWGVNAHRYDNVEPVHRMVERQDPQAVALLSGDETLTYGELNARANRLAHRLIAEGVGPDVRVGIAVPRSVEMLVGLLAILKAGGAYVPLDPEYPADRLAYMVESSGITLLLTHSTVTGLPPVRTTLELDTLDTRAHPAHTPQVPVHGENLAYVIYTSGSTGKPKGVMVRHRGLSHFLLSMQDQPGLTGDDVLLAVTSLSFDIAALELYLPLLCGARVVLAPREVVRDGRALGELMQARGVTALQSTPAGWRVLLAGGWRPSGPLKGLCGGEALQPDLAHTLRELGVALWNMYGPTETTIWSTAVPVRGDAAIGGPIGDTALRVLDAALQPVPAGVPGELYLGGVGLARGYLHRPDLAAERFVADPFDAEGGRLYRTGDLVRWRADGQLEYLGRIDHQVKIRGFRIELGEIETQLLAQPEVREAVVVAKDGRLVGYVAGEIEPAALRERLAQALPDYMVPGAILVLDTLPLNPNGKVDRKALPEPDAASGHLYEAPHGEAEAALAQIWSEVLGAARVGRHDTFFELGGHSLAALQVQARTQARFAVQIPLRLYFEGLSLSAIALALEAARQTQADESTELDEMSALLEALEN